MKQGKILFFLEFWKRDLKKSKFWIREMQPYTQCYVYTKYRDIFYEKKVFFFDIYR